MTDTFKIWSIVFFVNIFVLTTLTFDMNHDAEFSSYIQNKYTTHEFTANKFMDDETMEKQDSSTLSQATTVTIGNPLKWSSYIFEFMSFSITTDVSNVYEGVEKTIFIAASLLVIIIDLILISSVILSFLGLR